MNFMDAIFDAQRRRDIERDGQRRYGLPKRYRSWNDYLRDAIQQGMKDGDYLGEKKVSYSGTPEEMRLAEKFFEQVERSLVRLGLDSDFPIGFFDVFERPVTKLYFYVVDLRQIAAEAEKEIRELCDAAGDYGRSVRMERVFLHPDIEGRFRLAVLKLEQPRWIP